MSVAAPLPLPVCEALRVPLALAAWLALWLELGVAPWLGEPLGDGAPVAVCSCEAVGEAVTLSLGVALRVPPCVRDERCVRVTVSVAEGVPLWVRVTVRLGVTADDPVEEALRVAAADAVPVPEPVAVEVCDAEGAWLDVPEPVPVGADDED